MPIRYFFSLQNFFFFGTPYCMPVTGLWLILSVCISWMGRNVINAQTDAQDIERANRSFHRIGNSRKLDSGSTTAQWPMRPDSAKGPGRSDNRWQCRVAKMWAKCVREAATNPMMWKYEQYLNSLRCGTSAVLTPIDLHRQSIPVDVHSAARSGCIGWWMARTQPRHFFDTVTEYPSIGCGDLQHQTCSDCCVRWC